MKKIVDGLVLLVLAFVFAGCGGQKTMPKTKTNTSKQETVQKTAVPTVFFHGYSGTAGSFNGMIHRLEKRNITKKELLITVEKDGKLDVKGTLSGKKDNPSVQVVFADNKSHEWNQAEWIHNVLCYLKEQGVQQVNVVGHSMGGVSTMRYRITYEDTEDAAKIAKIVAIAAPFNHFIDDSENQSIEDLLANGPKTPSDQYEEYQAGIQQLSSKIPFLLIAGKLDKKTPSDGAVPLTSALSIYAALKKHGDSVAYQIFTGEHAQHSQLHENKEVDQCVSDFLWGN